jgi:hypothetical protein
VRGQEWGGGIDGKEIILLSFLSFVPSVQKMITGNESVSDFSRDFHAGSPIVSQIIRVS